MGVVLSTFSTTESTANHYYQGVVCCLGKKRRRSLMSDNEDDSYDDGVIITSPPSFLRTTIAYLGGGSIDGIDENGEAVIQVWQDNHGGGASLVSPKQQMPKKLISNGDGGAFVRVVQFGDANTTTSDSETEECDSASSSTSSLEEEHEEYEDDMESQRRSRPCNVSQTPAKLCRMVSFSCVQIREYAPVQGDHPWSEGIALSLDWHHTETTTVEIDTFEETKDSRQKGLERMTVEERKQRLANVGCGTFGDDASDKNGNDQNEEEEEASMGFEEEELLAPVTTRPFDRQNSFFSLYDENENEATDPEDDDGKAATRTRQQRFQREKSFCLFAEEGDAVFDNSEDHDVEAGLGGGLLDNTSVITCKKDSRRTVDEGMVEILLT